MKYRRNRQTTNWTEGKTHANLKTKALQQKSTTNKIRWYGHVLRNNKYGFPKKDLNIKLNGELPNGKNKMGTTTWERCHRKEGITQVQTEEKEEVEVDDKVACEVTNI